MKRIAITASLSALTLALIFAASCHRTPTCYDPVLAQNYKTAFCTADCPGVTGCDGKTYCNTCEAARHGIRVR